MLCNLGGLSKQDIGAIRIEKHESHIEIHENKVSTFLSAVGPDMTLEGDTLKQLDKPPASNRARRNRDSHHPRETRSDAANGRQFKHRKGKGGFKPLDKNFDDAAPGKKSKKPGKRGTKAKQGVEKESVRNSGENKAKPFKKRPRKPVGNQPRTDNKPAKRTRAPSKKATRSKSAS
jgi:ATP-dependent RNA helicase DeaD